MKNLFTVPFIFFILFACNCIAQEVPIFQWAKNLGGSSTEAATTIKTDASGNVYVGGYFNSSTADFDPGAGTVTLSSAGSDDAFICKLTSAGELVWARSFGSNSADYVTDLEIDDAGNVYATGYFANTVDFNPGTGTFNLTSAGSYDAFIVKLTTDGDFIWAGNVGGSSSDYGNQIALDNAGNVFITGHFFSSSADFNPGAGIVNFSSTGGTDVFVLKLDNNGSYQWARQFGGVGSDEGHTIAIDGLDNVVITGQFYDYSAPFDFDPGPATVTLTQVGSTISEWDIFICKLSNSTGDIAWAKSISAPRWDETEAMTVDNQNNILLTGHFSGTADFDPDGSVFQLTASGNTDPFIVKLNSSGNFLWAKSFAGSSSSVNQYGDYIVTDASRNVYTCGSLYSALDADPGPSVFNLSSSGQRDAYYSKLDENGNFIWAYRIGSNGFDRGHSITLDPFGSVYMAGYFSTTADFNPGTGTFNLTSNGSSDAFIQKITFGAPANPTITSFSPTAGAIGTPVTITGTNFSTTPANNIVQFNGTSTSVTASTTTSITTSVPAGATTGKITVTIAGNTATSATDFTVGAAALTITGFTPASGPAGTTVTITGTNFSTTPASNTVRFDNTPAIVTASTTTSITTTVPAGATTGKITVTVAGNTATSATDFVLPSCIEKLFDFTGTADGDEPWGTLISDGTFLYGLTANGGVNNMGVIFKIKPDGTGYVKLFDFDGTTNGRAPLGSLVSDGTFLYGMTAGGGVNNLGTVFKIKTDGSGFAKLLDFDGTTNGRSPEGSLFYDGTFLFGMTPGGGTNNRGVIFKIKPDGTGYVKLLDFAGAANGAYPYGSLISDGTSLYGMTQQGGTSDNGTIFKILKDGTGYVKLFNFGGYPQGEWPLRDLVFDGTYLYGMTERGGSENDGLIFKIRTDGTGYTKLLDFNTDTTGEGAFGSLIHAGAFLYGMTYTGAGREYGTLFKIKADGSEHTVMCRFVTYTDGALPYGSLFSDGTFLYGMTQMGGANDKGVIFRYALDGTPPLDNHAPVIQPAFIATLVGDIATLPLIDIISDEDDNLDLSTLTIVQQPASGAHAYIDNNVNLMIDYTGIPFSGTDYVTLNVCDTEAACAQQQISIEVMGTINIFNAISPNGDGKNETFIIQYIDILPETQSNNVTILNRWGDVVFEIQNYNNADRVFKGLGKNGQELPSGTYFYKIEFAGGRKSQTGYLSLKR